MTRAELHALLRCFPGARGYFTYGLTELGVPTPNLFTAGGRLLVAGDTITQGLERTKNGRGQ